MLTISDKCFGYVIWVEFLLNHPEIMNIDFCHIAVKTQILWWIIIVQKGVHCSSLSSFLLSSVGKAIDSEPPWYLSRIFLMCAVCIIFLLPLCLPKTLKVLSYSRYAEPNVSTTMEKINYVNKMYERHHYISFIAKNVL